MNEYLLASPADADLTNDVQAPGGTVEQTSDSDRGSSVEVARRPAASVAVVARRTPDAAAARSWDVGEISIRKRRWYDKFEPPKRRLLDAPSNGSADVGDRRGHPPVPTGVEQPVHAPPGATLPISAAPAAVLAAESATPIAAAPVETVSGSATVDYVAPAPTTNGSSHASLNGAASNGAVVVERQDLETSGVPHGLATATPGEYVTPTALQASEGDDGSALRRLDGSAPDTAGGAAVATLVAARPEVEPEPASMGLSESARYHNAEFEITEVETHDPVLSRTVIEWIAVVAGALIVALVIKAALFQAFYIPSPSMVPTLIEDDRVLVNKLSYRLHDIRAGDVVVFERPLSERGGDESDLIKRVIGLPGDTVRAENGKVFVDGAQLDEYYLSNVDTADFPNGEVVVGPGEIFVMGDNRGNSKDSRVYGAVDQELVVGRAFVKVWPISRIGLL